ncbi:phage tail protein [bacterium]|nr:phage tail protein [bacterium]
MAVFTYIATAIVGAIGSIAGIALTTGAGAALALTTAGTIATSLIAGGLAYATAKVTGVLKVPNIQAAKDPGVKVQLSPSTDRRVPVFYGRIHTGGIIVDAGIKNQNNTMVYCMVIGEQTDTGTFTVNSIKRQDSTLNFSGANVISQTDPNATSTTNVANKMRCRVYAGGTAAGNQIFPSTGTQVAATTLLPTITATTSYENLVFAVFEIDYDAENGLTGLGEITYEITNSLTNPSNVLLDYCKNSVYGAGLTDDELDLPSFVTMFDHCAEQVAYTTNLGAAATHARYQIDGVLSTYQAVKDNIDLICQSSSTFFTYDNKIGKFTVVPNREATTAEKSAAFVFNDNNIISSIDITSTELYSLYNSIDAEYPSVEQQDQTKSLIVSTPSGDRNTNEPDNPLQSRYSLVNDAPRVHNLANIDLRQSRLSTLVTFTADYSALTVDVGDVIKLTQPVYGYTEKLFRVMKVSEQEGETGYLSCAITAMEYADSIYAHNTVQSDGALDLSGIPGWWTGIWGNIDYGNIANIAGNITIVDDPVGGGNANVVDPPTGNVIANVDYANIVLGIGGEGGSGYGMIPSINFPITIPNIPDISEIMANITPTGSTVSSNVANSVPPTRIPLRPGRGPNGEDRTRFDPGEIVNVSLPQPPLPPQDISAPSGPLLPDILANIDLSFINPFGFSTINSTIPNIKLAGQGTIDRGSIGAVQAGLQVDDDTANVNTAGSSTVQDSDTANVQLGTANSLITPVDVIDTGGIDEGIYSSVNGLVPYGGFFNGARIGFAPGRGINYDQVAISGDGTITKTGNTVLDFISGSGIISTTNDVIPSLTDNFDYEVSRARGSIRAQQLGLPAANSTISYIPANIQVVNYANSNLTEDAGTNTFRGFDVTNADKRISKADAYVEPRYGGCFIAGSMVLMANGVWKEIEFVVIGEKVMGLNGVTNTVTKLHHHPVAQQVVYTIDNTISLTDTHPMLTVEGWKSFNPQGTTVLHPDLELAGELMIADTLVTHKGTKGLHDYTKSVQEIPVYNLDVDGDDTFIVDGYVVHNK